MKLNEIQKIDKLYFGYQDIARVLAISEDSAKVTASRYAKKGMLVRINPPVIPSASKIVMS